MTEPIPNKKLGQHWLHDDASLRAMVDAAEIHTGDYAVEIGPGLGTLTQYLLNSGAKVHAIEFDNELAKTLRKKLKAQPEQLIITEADIMRFNFAELPKNYKIVANIPYYLTSGLLRLISETTNPPTQVALLVQKEVAERVCAKPGHTSLLSISTQMYFEVSLGKLVPAELFTPPPKIDSQILMLKRREQPYFGTIDPKLLFRVVKAGFSERRKKLRSSLSGGLGLTKDDVGLILQNANISGDLRAQNLNLANWVVLTEQYIKFCNDKSIIS